MRTFVRFAVLRQRWVGRFGTTLLVGLVCGLSPFASSCADGQPQAQESSERTSEASSKRYVYREEHDPNGIGKFYMGREIARVMGFGFRGRGAAWLERPSREKEEKLSLLIKSLDLKPGMVVSDIGAGSGVISVLMAEQVTPGGTVLAVDVQQEMLDRLAKNLKRHDIDNVKPIKGTPKSPRLKPETVDLAIMVDVYHEFEFPYEMMLDIAQALKPGGRVAFVEYRKEDPTVPIKLVHKMSEAQVKKEISQPEFGLKWKETIGVLPQQHIVIFERVARDDAASNASASGR